ncbi:50S ribosomal protein L22 [Candidatus Microgenomates bacterium]|nr:50S ribosomal protein L22 [Candidatus Microgenomates bacterium]
MQVKAQAKQLRIAPRKLGLVAGLVRGRSVADALVILEHTPKRGAKLLREVVKSAQANADHNHQLPTKELRIDQILVSPGGIIKRYHLASRGSVMPINKRLSNVTVLIEAPDTTAATKAKTAGEKN